MTLVARRIASAVRRRRKVIIGIAVLLFILAFLWFVPELLTQYFSQGLVAENLPAVVSEYPRIWAQIIGGFFILLGVYLAWRRLKIPQRTLETQQDQQITQRLTRSIEQLEATDDKEGDPKLQIRLDGIYTLERIAKNSPEREYAKIVEVLTAYVRRNTPLPSGQPTESPSVPNGPSKQSARLEQCSTSAPQKKPRADIQAVLAVLGRRQEDRVPEEYRLQVDLQKTNLSRADLSRANLRGANLWGANLWGANLWGANLSGANLSGTNLSGTNLSGANLGGANLGGANLGGANLWGANLLGTNLLETEELTQKQLEQASVDTTTKLPEGLYPPLHSIYSDDEQPKGTE